MKPEYINFEFLKNLKEEEYYIVIKQSDISDIRNITGYCIDTIKYYSLNDTLLATIFYINGYNVGSTNIESWLSIPEKYFSDINWMFKIKRYFEHQLNTEFTSTISL